MDKADVILLQHELSPVLGSQADLVDSLKSEKIDADVRERAERILKRLKHIDKLLAEMKEKEVSPVQ